MTKMYNYFIIGAGVSIGFLFLPPLGNERYGTLRHQLYHMLPDINVQESDVYVYATNVHNSWSSPNRKRLVYGRVCHQCKHVHVKSYRGYNDDLDKSFIGYFLAEQTEKENYWY